MTFETLRLLAKCRWQTYLLTRRYRVWIGSTAPRGGRAQRTPTAPVLPQALALEMTPSAR